MNGFISDRLALVESCEYVSSLFKSDYDITVTGSMVKVKVGPIVTYARGFANARMDLESRVEDFFKGVA